MPPPKKAAKKSAQKGPQKGAKKAAKKTPGQRRGQDLRRAYEHLGRVVSLLPLLSESETVQRMSALAKALLGQGEAKDAADVLRAAEHLCFGTLAVEAPAESIPDELASIAKAEYISLLERADHHAAAGHMAPPVEKFFLLLRRSAVRASKGEKYRAASELARGAEALSHVTAEFTGRLRAGTMERLELT